MQATDQGVIIRTHPVTETSLIAQWLSRDHGLLSTIAKGARKPKSLFSGKLDLFFQADFAYRPSRRSDLHTLQEVNLIDTHASLREDLETLRRVVYASKLITLTAEPDTPIPGLHQLFIDLLNQRLGPLEQPWSVLLFELLLLQDQGLAPDLKHPRLSPGSSKLIATVLSVPARAVPRIVPSAAQHDEIAAFLGAIITSHAGTLPKGRQAALAPKAPPAPNRPTPK